MMMDYKFSERAYAKMIFHAAKYPHLAVNGVLLAEKKSTVPIVIVDAVPLFHQCLYVTPMAEIALMQIDAFAERNNLVIAGYYVAAEHFNDCSIDRAPAARIADKIYENYKQACFVVIDNTRMSMWQTEPAITVHAHGGEAGGHGSSDSGSANDSGRWPKASFKLQQSVTTLETVSALLKQGAMKDIIDFDNHLDNPENDWTNEFLNRDFKQIMAMY